MSPTEKKVCALRHAYSAFVFAAEILMRDLEGQAGGDATLPRVARIQAIVAADFHVPLGTMCAASRPRRYSVPRQVAMMLAREHTQHSNKDIGRSFGGRDHGTVKHACNAVLARMEQDGEFAAQVELTRERVLAALASLQFPNRVLAMAATA